MEISIKPRRYTMHQSSLINFKLKINYKLSKILTLYSIKVKMFLNRFITNTKLKIFLLKRWIIYIYYRLMKFLLKRIFLKTSEYNICLHVIFKPKKFSLSQNEILDSCSLYNCSSQKGMKNIVEEDGYIFPPSLRNLKLNFFYLSLATR